MVDATPRLLYPLEREPVPILHESGCTPEQLWIGAEYFAQAGIRFVERPAV